MLNPSPSCLHATKASLVVQPSLHTLPHRCPTRTSTRPSYCERPPDRRTCNHNLRHVKHTHISPRSPCLLPSAAYPHTQTDDPAEKTRASFIKHTRGFMESKLHGFHSTGFIKAKPGLKMFLCTPTEEHAYKLIYQNIVTIFVIV